MADDKGSGTWYNDVEFSTWLIGMLFFLVLASSIVGYLNENFGIDFTDLSGSIENVGENFGLEPLTTTTPLGTNVRTIRDVDVWELAGGGTLLGTQNEDAAGVLIGGPELVSEVQWWMVDFEGAPDGWVEEDALGVVPGGTVGFVQYLGRLGVRISYIVSSVLLLLFLWVFFLIHRLNKRERAKLGVPGLDAFIPEEREVLNARWVRVQELAGSGNPHEWRQAIVEADIMLDDLLTRLSFTEGSIGDKLKSVEPSDFETLDDAWEAHKVRNRIVHEGSDFILTPEQVRRVVARYEKVFREFDFI